MGEKRSKLAVVMRELAEVKAENERLHAERDDAVTRFAALQASTAQLAQAARIVQARAAAVEAEMVRLVPAEAEPDVLSTSLGSFPICRQQVAGVTVVAVRTLAPDSSLADHLAEEIGRRYGRRGLAVLLPMDTDLHGTVRLFRVEPVGASAGGTAAWPSSMAGSDTPGDGAAPLIDNAGGLTDQQESCGDAADAADTAALPADLARTVDA